MAKACGRARVCICVSGANKFVQDNYITYNRDRQLTAVVTTLFISPCSPWPFRPLSSTFLVHVFFHASHFVRKGRHRHLTYLMNPGVINAITFINYNTLVFTDLYIYRIRLNGNGNNGHVRT